MKKLELQQIIREEIGKVLNENRYEIFDPQQNDKSLDNIVKAIELLNASGLQLTPEDEKGHYSGGYTYVNSMYVNSPLSFDKLIRKANDILFKNDMKHLRIIKV